MSSTTTPTQSPQAGGKLPPEHDGFAIASLVTAFFLPVLGIIFGHLSNHRAKLAHRAKSGLAVAGLVLGYLFAVISVLVIIIVAAAASSTTSASITPAPSASSAPASPAPSASSAPVQAPTSQAPATGTIGDTATITDGSGNIYSVTAKQVIDPAQPADEFNTAPNGQHLVGVVFTIKATSSTVNDAADNCATLMGSDGQAYDSTVSSIAGYNNTTTLIKLNAGESQTLAVVFQIPNGVKATTVKWTPNSGMADSTATWNVAG
jgi:heme/copper-type cytochrome/quinol oxidase subunit 2